MLSSFIFGLFLYRAKLSSWRVIASRFAVVVVCNFIVNPLVMTLYNAVTGVDPYKFITIARVIKNAAMFPLESVVLVIWLGAISMALYKMHLLPEKPPMIKVSAGNIVALVCAAVISALAIFGYVKWKNQTQSRSRINSRPDNGNSRTDGRCAEYAVKVNIRTANNAVITSVRFQTARPVGGDFGC